jgi:crotonobetainyl-CoA:carnitine CoA-transferase CaiB-like acyl-CoA transferase
MPLAPALARLHRELKSQLDPHGIASPNTFPGAARSEYRPPPLQGEQSCEILIELGYDAKEIQAMIDANQVIGTWHQTSEVASLKREN